MHVCVVQEWEQVVLYQRAVWEGTRAQREREKEMQREWSERERQTQRERELLWDVLGFDPAPSKPSSNPSNSWVRVEPEDFRSMRSIRIEGHRTWVLLLDQSNQSKESRDFHPVSCSRPKMDRPFGADPEPSSCHGTLDCEPGRNPAGCRDHIVMDAGFTRSCVLGK